MVSWLVIVKTYRVKQDMMVKLYRFMLFGLDRIITMPEWVFCWLYFNLRSYYYCNVWVGALCWSYYGCVHIFFICVAMRGLYHDYWDLEWLTLIFTIVELIIHLFLFMKLVPLRKTNFERKWDNLPNALAKKYAGKVDW